MIYNRPSGAPAEELHERAVAALTREWGVTEQQARDAIMRVSSEELRLGMVARARRVA